MRGEITGFTSDASHLDRPNISFTYDHSTVFGHRAARVCFAVIYMLTFTKGHFGIITH